MFIVFLRVCLLSSRLPNSESATNTSKKTNDVVFEEISNTDDLNTFLLDAAEEISTVEALTNFDGKEENQSGDCFKSNEFKLGYVVKDNVFYIVKTSDNQEIKNEIFKEKETVNKKIFFNDKILENPKTANTEVTNNSLWSISTGEDQVSSVLNYPNQEPRTSLPTSTCSSNQNTFKSCNFVCCPKKLGSVVSDLKKAIVNFLIENDEDDIFLDIEIRSIVTEMFCINRLLSKSLLVLYPDVLKMDGYKKHLLFTELGYKKGTSLADHDRKLFITLRRSFLVKHRKYKELCKKWTKKTGEEFNQFEENEISKFHKNIEIINVILFETLLIDVGIV